MNLVVLITILLAVAFLLRIDFIYYIVYVCIGILLLSRLLVPRIMRRLVASRSFNDHAFGGETVDIELHLQNQSRLPLPWLWMMSWALWESSIICPKSNSSRVI